jgi:hypothetical protein
MSGRPVEEPVAGAPGDVTSGFGYGTMEHGLMVVRIADKEVIEWVCSMCPCSPRKKARWYGIDVVDQLVTRPAVRNHLASSLFGRQENHHLVLSRRKRRAVEVGFAAVLTILRRSRCGLSSRIFASSASLPAMFKVDSLFAAALARPRTGLSSPAQRVSRVVISHFQPVLRLRCSSFGPNSLTNTQTATSMSGNPTPPVRSRCSWDTMTW